MRGTGGMQAGCQRVIVCGTPCSDGKLACVLELETMNLERSHGTIALGQARTQNDSKAVKGGFSLVLWPVGDY